MMFRPTSVIATANGSGNKTNVFLATRVWVFNSNSGEKTITMTDADTVTIGTFKLARRSGEIVWKNPTECFFAGDDTVEYTAIETRG